MASPSDRRKHQETSGSECAFFVGIVFFLFFTRVTPAESEFAWEKYRAGLFGEIGSSTRIPSLSLRQTDESTVGSWTLDPPTATRSCTSLCFKTRPHRRNTRAYIILTHHVTLFQSMNWMKVDFNGYLKTFEPLDFLQIFPPQLQVTGWALRSYLPCAAATTGPVSTTAEAKPSMIATKASASPSQPRQRSTRGHKLQRSPRKVAISVITCQQ